MSLLRWKETNAGTSRSFLKAEIVHIDMDFIDLCEGRFWGGSRFYFDLKFTIHERIVKSNDWNYQLLAPNGIHIYCKDVEEAKELAEVIYKRIAGAVLEQMNKKPEREQLPEGELARRLNESLAMSKMTTEQFNRVMYRRHCKNLKHKTEKLFSVAKKRGIVSARIWYSRLRGQTGWMINLEGGAPQLLGSNYQQAEEMLYSGTFDCYANQA